MISLKTESSGAQPVEMPEQPYGWGTCIRLTSDQCEALGITKAIPAGTVVMVRAKAYVAESTERVEGDDAAEVEGPDVCVSLQLTDMELQPQTGGKFYENSDMNP